MTVYIYSTLAVDMAYTIYANEKDASGLSIIEKQIYIKGGAGVVDPKSTQGNFYTPKGVVTKVTDEELEMLEKNHVFNLHKDRGHILIEKSQKPVEKVIEGMNEKENSSPLTPDDFVESSEGGKKLKPRGK